MMNLKIKHVDFLRERYFSHAAEQDRALVASHSCAGDYEAARKGSNNADLVFSARAFAAKHLSLP